MEKKIDTPFNTLCVWPGTLIGPSDTSKVVDWFAVRFNIRIADVQEIKTVSRCVDGTFRHDLIFTMHEEDVSKVANTELSKELQWWGDWVAQRPDDFTDFQREMFKSFES